MTDGLKKQIRDAFSDVNYRTIILFGSRARGDAALLSDCDLLVILNEHLSAPEKIRLSSILRQKLAQKGIDADIILKSPEEVEYYKDKIGNVVRSALQEGIVL